MSKRHWEGGGRRENLGKGRAWEELPEPGGSRAANVSTRAVQLCAGRWAVADTGNMAPGSTATDHPFMLAHCLLSLLHCEFSEQHGCVRFIFISTTHTAIPVIQQEFNKC